MSNNDSENKRKHLEMIEGIIERMGNNSFQLKGWAVTLVSVIGAFSSQGTDKRFFLISFIPILAFWFLDSLYLQYERKYKILYDKVTQLSDDKIDFKMDINCLTYSGNDAKKVKYKNCLFSKTEIIFYGVITVAVTILAIILIFY